MLDMQPIRNNIRDLYSYVQCCERLKDLLSVIPYKLYRISDQCVESNILVERGAYADSTPSLHKGFEVF